MKQIVTVLSTAILLLAYTVVPACCGNESDRQAIEKTIDTYVQAFNHGDAGALAAQWTENGDYMDATGKHVRGREAIKNAYEAYFAENPSPHIEITVTSAQFANDHLVIEDGYRDIGSTPIGPATRIRYTAVHVKKDGKWFVQSVRDAVAFKPSNYDHLKDLEWAIGEWADESQGGALVQSSCTWSENRNFIIRSFTTSVGGNVLISGTQWLGWDPIKKEIRSWRFDSNGGFGEGVWTRDGDKWTVKATSVLQSGEKVLETHIITVLDPNTVTWATKERSIDGKPLPDTPPVTIKRRR